MMEDISLPDIPDIETAGGAVAQQQQPEHRKPAHKKYAIITAGVVGLTLIAAGIVMGTRQPGGGDSDSVQAAFLTQEENATLISTGAPPALHTDSPIPADNSSKCAINGECSEEGSTCAIGTETCCGQTFNSLECECSFGQWLCMATDACYRPDCGDQNITAPSCNYSGPGKYCSADDDCTCGDVCLDSFFDDFRVCGCEVGTTNGCDPNSNKPFCYKGFTAAGVDCGCRDDNDCEGDETCGTSWCVANIVPFCSVDHNAQCPPTQSPLNSFIPPGTYPPTIGNNMADDPTAAPTPVSTVTDTTVDTPEPTDSVTALPTSDPTKATPGPTEVGTTVDTPAPTDAVTTNPTPEPTEIGTSVDTPAPTDAVTTTSTPGPTDVVTAPPTPEPTEIGTTTDSTPVPTGAVITTVPTHMPTPSTSDDPIGPTSCVNIKFTTDNYPEDNGFTFLNTKSGEVLYQEDAGFMEEPQSEYLQTFCNLSPGSYTLIVTDEGSDGMFTNGGGSYVVDIDGRVILVGGRFRKTEISHEIIVGINAIISETDQGFLDAHNLHREEFHENQEVSFRPMAWSAELAAGASAWAKEKAKTCSNDNKEKGMFGQNASSQRLIRPDLARSPEMIVGWWMNGFNPEATSWGATLQPGGAVLWRTALYVGCAAEVAPIENCPETQIACFCQVTNCRYSRTTNCAVKKDNWLDSVLDDNGQLCNSVFCPGADENGTIVEGACHV